MPITGKKKHELTMDSVLARTSDLAIFTHFMPNKNWELNCATNSVFREDKNPSLVIGNKMGYISYIDWGAPEYRGDCFNFVKQLHNLSNLDAVLRLIDSSMGLGIQSGSEPITAPLSVINKKQEVNKRTAFIQIVTRKFTKEELAYWAAYHIDIQDLLDNNIYSIKTLYLNRQRFPINDNELRFGYFYNGFWKCYFPNREKKKKWVPNNVPNQTSWGVENLDKEKCSIVTKSRKDYIVLRKIYPHICSVQKEGVDAFSDEFVEQIKTKSSCVYYGGDSDVPGKKASYSITEKFGFKHVNPPDRLLPETKDWADWAKLEGLGAVEEHLKIKGII